MNEQNTPVLEAVGLRFAISDAVAAGPIDLTVEAGTTLGIVGETGSGKSLFCRTIAGMLHSIGGRLTGGTIAYAGTDFASATPAEWSRLRRTQVGYMPQASLSGLNPVRRIGSQLVEVLLITGQAGRASRIASARRLLEQVQLVDVERVMNSYPHELSGGMRQRVMLAMALAGDPQLLIADEPTTALDATVQSEVLDLIRSVQQDRNMAVIIVSHDMRVIRRACDRMAVMYGGRIIESGPVGKIIAAPAHPYTRGLLLSDPALAARKTLLGSIPGSPRPSAEWNDGGCNFRERCAFATDVCAVSDPTLVSVGADRAAACLHSMEVAAA